MKKLLCITFVLASFLSSNSYSQAQLTVLGSTSFVTQTLDSASAGFRIENRGDQVSRRFRVKMWASKDTNFTDDEVIDDAQVSSSGIGLNPDGSFLSLRAGPDGFYDGIEPTITVNRSLRWIVNYRFSYGLPLADDLTPGGNPKAKSQLLGSVYHYQACIIFEGSDDCDPSPAFTGQDQTTLVPPRVRNIQLTGDNLNELQLIWSEVPFDEFEDDAGILQSVDFVSFYRIKRIDHNSLTTTLDIAPSALDRVVVDGQDRLSLTFDELDGIVRGKRNSFVVESCHNTAISGAPVLVCLPFSPRRPNTGIDLSTGAIEQAFNASEGSNNDGILVQWDEPTANVLRYQLERCVDGSDNCTLIEVDGANTSFLDTQVSRGSLYSYSISACDRVFTAINTTIPDDPRIGRCWENGRDIYKFGQTNFGFRGLVDQYEDDDSPAQATVVNRSVEQVHSFDSSVDDDWVRIELAETGPITIETSSFAGENVDTVLSLYDSSLQLLLENDDADVEVAVASFSKIETDNLEPGTYFVKATHFRLPIDGFPAPTADNYLLSIELKSKKVDISAIIKLLLLDE